MQISKYIRRIILLVACCVYGIIALAYWWYTPTMVHQPFVKNMGIGCGTVVENFTELRTIKYGTETDYYLKIQYDSLTEIKNVSATTFYKNYKIGTTVCFVQHETFPTWVIIGLFMSIICLFILFTYILYFCVSIFV